MFAHYIHAFLLIHFIYCVAYAMRKFRSFFGPPGIKRYRYPYSITQSRVLELILVL